MGDVNCVEMVQMLNVVFGGPLILNDGHEILARLEGGDGLVDIVDDLNEKFGNPEGAEVLRRTVAGWPAIHLEAVGQMVQWALSKLDTEDRIRIEYKGDADHPETVTRFEIRDHTLVVEFAHPPFGSDRRAVTA